MKFKINPFFFLVWILFLVIGKSSSVLFLFICAAAHEIGHICAFYFFGARLSVIELLPFGISAKLIDETKVSYKQEIICMLAGPGVNLIMAVLCIAAQMCLKMAGADSGIMGLDFLFICNIAFAIVNIIPIYPLDGGRAIYCLLETKLSPDKASGISLMLSYIFLIPLLVCGIALIIYTGCNFSLLLIFGYLLLYLLVKRIN